MNRSILIVICDFLLVSLLVFSSPDLTKVTGESGANATPNTEQATNAPSGGKDLANVMRTALTEEQLGLVWRMGEEPILCFDGDKAGRRAAYRAIDLALPVGGHVPGVHIHPLQEERFEVTSGRMKFRYGLRTIVAEAGAPGLASRIETAAFWIPTPSRVRRAATSSASPAYRGSLT